jgi:hypothetical protein
MEFCNKDTSWLVDYKLVYLDKEDYIFVTPGQQWAEPDIEHASQCMLEVYQNNDLRIHRVNNAKKYVLKNFSEKNISKKYFKL